MGAAHAITDWQLERRDGTLLLGLAVSGAVLDIQSDDATLTACLRLLETPALGLRDLRIGRFGEFVITLNHHHDDTVSIFLDGPGFSPRRTQSAAIWVEKASLCCILNQVIGGCRER